MKFSRLDSARLVATRFSFSFSLHVLMTVAGENMMAE
jgi:hypothetical protein